MQNKGAIKLFAILFALVCLFQLSFTFFTSRVQKKARTYATNEVAAKLSKDLAKGDPASEVYYFDSISRSRENYYLDSMSNQVVYNLLLRKYTYMDCKEREVNLGLDLKGGMNVMLEVSIGDIIRGLAKNNQSPVFQEAMNRAAEKQKESQKDFVTLFGESLEEIDPNFQLASIFLFEFKDKGISATSTNKEVLDMIRQETDGAFDRTFQILRTRIDRFGVAQPNVQKLAATGRILVELPGIKDPERVRKLLQGTAHLEFWETQNFNEIAQYFAEANKKLRGVDLEADSTAVTDSTNAAAADSSMTLAADTAKKATDTTLAASDTSSLLDKLGKDTSQVKTDQQTFEDYAKENPLNAFLIPAFYQQGGQYYPGKSATVGYAAIKDTARINRMLRLTSKVFPANLKLAWTIKPREEGTNVLELIALKVTSRDGTPALDGGAIVNARQDYDQNGKIEVSMSMNAEGGRTWKRLTGENIGKQIAIVLDGYVYSAPVVQGEIPNGQSSITGIGSIEEGQDLANILKAGKLPARAKIVQEAVVGPSLGTESINNGMRSFLIAFFLVLVYMILYYNRAGWVADFALLCNLFFLFGVLASFGAVLTMPGIAGIVLTMGMAVDANVIIYERIKEELRAGKGLRLAVADGYKNAYSAIIDGNVTTILTGIVLFIFGSGPVQGFATTLIIGILTSLFSAIFISRLIFLWILDRNKTILFSHPITENTFVNANFDFIKARKIAYIVSICLIVPGIISLFVRGLNFGIDFSGGRTYVVRFDQDVKTNDVRDALSTAFIDEKGNNFKPEVKTFGPNSQVKITTKYKIQEMDPQIDSLIETKLFEELKPLYRNQNLVFDEFVSTKENRYVGIMSSEMVGPTIADDIKVRAVWAVFFSLIIIFIYIAFRFKKWQFGLGGVISLFHDTLLIIGIFSLFYNVLPMNMEVDQAFIAAILTIIGYSINDTVIIFDRIREYNTLYPKRNLKDNMNGAINHTLARTMNTAGTTVITLLAIMLFGGETIKGFAFALTLGVIAGTYSSVFNASALAYDLMKGSLKRKELKLKEAAAASDK